MSKTDLTGYGEQELSLNVLNTQSLYRAFIRCSDEDELRSLVSGVFTYTDEQFDELMNDLVNEWEEQAS